eukprot:3635634-Lingulodinium_polyedra.AAC.1
MSMPPSETSTDCNRLRALQLPPPGAGGGSGGVSVSSPRNVRGFIGLLPVSAGGCFMSLAKTSPPVT